VNQQKERRGEERRGGKKRGEERGGSGLMTSYDDFAAVNIKVAALERAS